MKGYAYEASFIMASSDPFTIPNFKKIKINTHTHKSYFLGRIRKENKIKTKNMTGVVCWK